MVLRSCLYIMLFNFDDDEIIIDWQQFRHVKCIYQMNHWSL